MSKDGASMSRSIGLCLGRGAGGSATVSPDWDWVCAIAAPAASATTISTANARMAARLYMGPFRLETGAACGAPGARVSIGSLLGRAGEKIEQHPDKAVQN